MSEFSNYDVLSCLSSSVSLVKQYLDVKTKSNISVSMWVLGFENIELRVGFHPPDISNRYDLVTLTIDMVKEIFKLDLKYSTEKSESDTLVFDWVYSYPCPDDDD